MLAAHGFLIENQLDMALIRACVDDGCIVSWTAVHPDARVLNMCFIFESFEQLGADLIRITHEDIQNAMQTTPDIMNGIVSVVHLASST